MSGYISREEAVEKLAQYMISVTKQFNMTALPYAVYESRARSVLKDIPGRQIEQVVSKLQNHLNVLSTLPSAEAVQVVRCKDCKHRYYADNRVPHERTWVCERFSNEENTDNDFCSFGERSDE